MRHHSQRLPTHVRQSPPGSPPQSAAYAALQPRGSAWGIRAVLLVTGALWLGLVLVDTLARPWQRRPKSWEFFQGPREFNEAPNLSRRLDETRTSGPLGRDLGVISLATPYVMREDTTRTYLETNAQGFRTVASSPPFTLALCGDSFSNNNYFAEALAQTTGLMVGNQAIEGRGTLTIARFLEDRPADYRMTKIVLWESTQRAAINDFAKIAAYRNELRQPKSGSYKWRQSLLWPANLELYLQGSSFSKPVLDKIQKEMKWRLLKKHTDLIVLGRRDLPKEQAPMLFIQADEAIRANATPQTQLDSIADCIATVDHDLKARGQILVFAVAPEKSVVYPDRLPIGVTARISYVDGLNAALRQRGVRVVDWSKGLKQAALSHPLDLYYYTADTHWTPKGMRIASQIFADSLVKWQLTPGRVH